MNNTIKKFTSIFLSVILYLLITNSASATLLNPKTSDTNSISSTTIIVQDNDSTTNLPNRFKYFW